MERQSISYYRPPIGLAVIPTTSKTLGDIYKIITSNPALQTATERLREILNTQGEDSYRTEKRKSLPSVTFGGVFDYRHSDPERLLEDTRKKLETETDPEKRESLERKIQTLTGKKGLLSLSGYLVIDIDHISQTGVSLEELRDRLSKDREIGLRLVFVSPSGDGLKLVCETSAKMKDPQSYKEVFKSLQGYINKHYSTSGEIVDRSGSDITRLCLLPFDRDAILLDSEDTFSPERHPVSTPERPTQREDYSRISQRYRGDSVSGDGVEEIVRRVEESGLDIAPDYKDYLPLVYSFTALGTRGKDLLHRVCRFSPKYVPEKTDTDWEECLKSPETQDIGYFINLCKKSGIDVSNPSGYTRRERTQTGKTHQRQTPSTDTPPEYSLEEFTEVKDLREIARAKRGGIETSYKFTTPQGREESLVLPSGALTLVCGKSSHGKSRLLQNLSLQIASKEYNSGGSGVVLYFSFEEGLLEVVTRFANIAINIPHLSGYPTPNSEVIRDYFETGTLSKSPRETRQTALPLLSGFVDSLYNSGRLRIYYTPDLHSGELCTLLEELSKRWRIKAVFLDYVQAIYKEDYRGDRREELREICRDINKTAISLDIPIVLSAQLNRETSNPTDMSGDNIAESADITRYANTILLLWDSAKERDIRGGKSTYTSTPEGQTLQSRGFILGERGKLYAVISKNRGGTPDIDTILDYVPETGKVQDNEDLPEDLSGVLDYN